MPSVINQVIIPNTDLAPGTRLVSATVDVEGTESISINVSITNINDKIVRKIHFGPSPNGAFPLTRSDTFAVTNHLMTSIPTSGPKVFIVVENSRTESMKCSGWIYAVRKVL
jgi:hypothetical protein